MINISSLIPLIVIGITIISMVLAYKRANSEKEKYENVKDGRDAKILLTKEELLKASGSSSTTFIIGGIMFAGFLIFFVMNNKMNFNTTYPIAFISIAAMILIMLYGIISNNRIKKDIKMGNYYVEEDILKNKYKHTSDNKTTYYFQFQQHEKRIETSRHDFNSSEVGEKFYIIYIRNKRLAYNTLLYQLEDESVITKRI